MRLPIGLCRHLGLVAVLILAACSTQTPEDLNSKWNQERLSSVITEVSRDFSTVLASSSFDLGILAALPAGSPVDSLGTLLTDDILNPSMTDPDAVTRLGATFLELQDASKRTLQVAPSQETATGLPRGDWVWDDATANWTLTGENDDLVLQFPYVGPDESVLVVQVTFDWDVNSATKQVNSYYGPVEVPTDMTVEIQVAGRTVGAVSLQADWLASSCGYDLLEPASFSLTGDIGGEPYSDRLRFAVNFSDPDGSGEISTDGFVSLDVAGDRANLDWDIDLSGAVSRDDNCFLTDYVLQSGAVSAGLDVTLGGETNTLELSFGFGDIVTGPNGEFAAEIINGEVTVNGSAVAAFYGTLDDANGNGTAGENVIVTVGEELTDLEALTFATFGDLPLPDLPVNPEIPFTNTP